MNFLPQRGRASPGRAIWLAAFAISLGPHTSAAAGPEARAVLQTSMLEHVSRQPGSEVVSAREVGRLASDGSVATVTALVIENPYRNPARVRGIRIDLTHRHSAGRIYIDEPDLVYHLHELNFLDCSVAMTNGDPASRAGSMGIARCRPSNPEPQPYCPAYGGEQGLSLSIFNGPTFRFPTVRPSQLAQAIDKALGEFDLDNQLPSVGVSAAHVDSILASAVRHAPELAASGGIKAAQYNGRDRRSAWAVFQPHQRSGDMAYAYSASCSATDGAGNDWQCHSVRPREYLQLPGQEAEVVITGRLGRDKALALVEAATRKLGDQFDGIDTGGWTLTHITPPIHNLEHFYVLWKDGAGRSISVEVAELPASGSGGFAVVELSVADKPACGESSY